MEELIKKFLEAIEGLLTGMATNNALADAGASPDAVRSAVTGSVDLPTGYNRTAEETRQRLAICAFVRQQVGKPYHLGVEVPFASQDPNEWDCSELTENAYRRAGLMLPDGSNYQYDYCRPVKEPVGGDLGFVWSDAWGRIGHVVVCMGDGSIIEARGKPVSHVQVAPMHDWEAHPRWRGWRRHPDFARAPGDRL